MRIGLWLSVLMGGALLFGGIHRTWHSTSTDAFCSRCHSMHPFFKTHRSGPHAKLACARCHIGEDLPCAVRAKAAGGRFLAIHHLGPTTEPQGVVDDRTCRTADCHPQGGGDSIPWQGLLFHHSQHRLSGRGFMGRELRCTQCHGTARLKGHGTAVRRESCLVCHLAGEHGLPGEERDRACLVCHAMPVTVNLGGGAVLDHAEVRAAGHACAECHGVQSTRPSRPGAEQCRACHAGRPGGHLAAVGIRGRVHNNHVRRLSLDCSRCHQHPRHRTPAPWDAEFPRAGAACGHVSGKAKGQGQGRANVLIRCAFCHRGERGGPLREDRCTQCHPRR